MRLAFTIFIGMFLCLCIKSSDAQVTMNGNITLWIDSINNAMPVGYHTNEYQVPTENQRVIWDSVVSNMLMGEYANAHTFAGQIGYRVINFIDTVYKPAREYNVLGMVPGEHNYWGYFVIYDGTARPGLFIVAPHPRYDLHTEAEAFYIFRELRAPYYFVSGTHRCNNSDSSICDGLTAVCSGNVSEHFRVSDQPHVESGTLQVTTRVFLREIPEFTMIQFHGYGKQPGDPYAILSNGTKHSPSSTDYAIQFRDNLSSYLPWMTYKIGHIDTNWNRLTATTNMQGRIMNGVADPCFTNSTSPTGRFLHIEQSDTLRDDENLWVYIKDAVGDMFPEVGISQISSEVPSGFRLYQNYPNPFNPTSTVLIDVPKQSFIRLSVYDTTGKEVALLVNDRLNPGKYKYTFQGGGYPSGIYFCTLQAQGERYTTKMVLVK